MATTEMNVGDRSRPMTAEERKVIIASSAGTIFEWYDFYLYATLAPFFAALFFPAALAAGIIIILMFMLVPMPPALVDVGLSISITFSVMILMITTPIMAIKNFPMICEMVFQRILRAMDTEE